MHPCQHLSQNYIQLQSNTETHHVTHWDEPIFQIAVSSGAVMGGTKTSLGRRGIEETKESNAKTVRKRVVREGIVVKGVGG